MWKVRPPSSLTPFPCSTPHPLTRPQLILFARSVQLLSIIREYFENTVGSTIQARHELYRYGLAPTGLRVTQPAGGAQRSTYLLSLPLPKALTHMALTAFWHTALSSALSLELVNLYHVDDPTTPHLQASSGGIIRMLAEKRDKNYSVVGWVIYSSFIGVGIWVIHGLFVNTLFYGSAVRSWWRRRREAWRTRKERKCSMKEWGKKKEKKRKKVQKPWKSDVAPNSQLIADACHPPPEAGDISQKKVVLFFYLG